MRKAKLKGAAALVFGMSLAVVPWDSESGKTVEIEGYVHSAGDSRGAPGPPAVGAVVSTSLDTTSSVTDRSGYFHLRTGRRASGDEYYTISVQTAGMVYRQRGVAVPRKGTAFVLTTPTRIDS